MKAKLLLIVFGVCFLCVHCRSSPVPGPSGQHTPVIIDTDIGSYIDDSYAIAFALQSNEHLDVKLIVTCTDNTTARAKIAAKLLTIAGCDHIPLGIGIANDNITNHTLWEWAEDFSLSDYKGGVYENGVDQMAKIILSSDSVVDILAIGPMTNFPLLLQKYPDVVKKARIRAMAGSIYRGYDNSTTPTEEYNVKLCPHCLNTVLRAGWEVTLAPLDTGGVASLLPENLQHLIASSNTWSFGLDAHTLFWCTKGVILCHLNIATISLPDTVATLLTLPNFADFVDLETLNLVVTDEGYVKINNTNGVSTQVALYWKENLVGLNNFRRYMISTLVESGEK
jgi:inosine-uridine nucleoside N-ribohydrolase